jgi:bifunctional non-homologous end joining protein LigD
MLQRAFPPGFIVPAQPVQQDKPPSGPGWIHEIKHDGYRLLVRRDGETVRLWTRNAVDYTDRLTGIAAAAARLKAWSFTIDGEAVVLGPDGLSRFDELRSRDGACTAMLYAFDLIEINGDDLRTLPLETRKATLASLLRNAGTIRLNEHIEADGAVVFAHACKLGAEGIVSKRLGSPYRSGPHAAWIKTKNPAAIAVQRERSENWNRGPR